MTDGGIPPVSDAVHDCEEIHEAQVSRNRKLDVLYAGFHEYVEEMICELRLVRNGNPLPATTPVELANIPITGETIVADCAPWPALRADPPTHPGFLGSNEDCSLHWRINSSDSDSDDECPSHDHIAQTEST